MPNPVIEFFVPGFAQPGGSKRAFPFKRKNGSLGVAVSDANPKVHAWREVCVHAAARAIQAPFLGPVKLDVVFAMARPKGHYGKKGLKSSAPMWHTKKPDTTKLLRALEDSLKGVAWIDDSQVVTQSAMKRYTLDGEPPGAGVRISAFSEVDRHTTL